MYIDRETVDASDREAGHCDVLISIVTNWPRDRLWQMEMIHQDIFSIKSTDEMGWERLCKSKSARRELPELLNWYPWLSTTTQVCKCLESRFIRRWGHRWASRDWLDLNVRNAGETPNLEMLGWSSVENALWSSAHSLQDDYQSRRRRENGGPERSLVNSEGWSTEFGIEWLLILHCEEYFAWAS